MTEPTAGRRESPAVAPEISSKYLPPLTYREMPEPKRLRKLIGPGVIVAATGLGSGEYVLWPSIAAQAGLSFLWAAVFGMVLFFVIGVECSRYTLATGETIVTGFTRLWKPWWLIFVLIALVLDMWPGYAAGTATTLTFVFGGGNVLLITILAMVAIFLSLILSPVVYQVVEKAQKIMVAAMLVFFGYAAYLVARSDVWQEGASGVASFGAIPEGIPFSTLAAAVAFIGSGGLGIIAMSYYIREKSMAMGAHIPRVVSPITGNEEPGTNLGYFFPQDEANLRRWRGWWRVTNQEQFVTFFLLSLLGVVVMSALAYVTVFGEGVGADFEFIRAEGQALGELVGPWLMIFFWVVGTMALFSTNLGAWDQVGRLCADAIKANWLQGSRFWSESRLYAAVVTILFVVGVVILLVGLQQPIVLLVISAVLSGGVSCLYSVLLIALNRFMLPRSIRMGNVRLLFMCVAVVFFGFFFVVTVLNELGVVS